MDECKFCSIPVVICNTINFVININSKRNTIKAFVADAASETARVI